MKTIRINNKESLKRFLEAIVDESIDLARTGLTEDFDQMLQREADDERDKQEKAKNDVDALFNDKKEKQQKKKRPNKKDNDNDVDMNDLNFDDLNLDSEEDEEKEIDTSDAATQAAKTITVTEDVNGVIELLNLIRSGRSLKTPDVLEELTKWVEQMSDSEQLALVTFLSGIKDIVTAGESAEEADDPEKKGVQISSAKEEDISPEDKEIVTGEAPRVSQVTSVEDTSAPIQVGPRNESYRKAYRDRIKKLMAG